MIDLLLVGATIGVVILSLSITMIEGSVRQLGDDPSYSFGQRGCEKITIPMCVDMPYNATRMPNLIKHYSQAEAAIEVHEFMPLVELGCSSSLKFFLCSLYAPMCTDNIPVNIPGGIPACRSVCQEVRSSCLPVLRRFNFSWPDKLNCRQLPQPPELCMKEPNHSSSTVLHGSSFSNKKFEDKLWSSTLDRQSITSSSSSCLGPRIWVPTRHGGVCAPLCGRDFLYRTEDKYLTAVWMVVWSVLCALSTVVTVLTFCLDTRRFLYPERPIIYLAICYLGYCLPFIARGILSASLLSCEVSPSDPSTIEGITSHLVVGGLKTPGCVITFILQYYLGLASALWWLVLTISWFLSAGRFMVQEALRSYATYFHIVAWGIPAIATILALTLKHVDGDELLGLCYVGSLRKSSLMWFVIAPLTAILGLGTFFILLGFCAMFRIRSVMKNAANQCELSGEKLTRHPMNIPSSILGGMGEIQTTTTTTTTTTTPITTTIPDVVGRHGIVKSSRVGQNLDKLEKLMARIGLFSVLYIVPAACVIGCYLYQYLNHDVWPRKAVSSCVSSSTLSLPVPLYPSASSSSGTIHRQQQQQQHNRLPPIYPSSKYHQNQFLLKATQYKDCKTEKTVPSVEVFLLRIFMSLVVGITSGVWVWSQKTVMIWKHFLRGLCISHTNRFRKMKGNFYQPPVQQQQLQQQQLQQQQQLNLLPPLHLQQQQQSQLQHHHQHQYLQQVPLLRKSVDSPQQSSLNALNSSSSGILKEQSSGINQVPPSVSSQSSSLFTKPIPHQFALQQQQQILMQQQQQQQQQQQHHQLQHQHHFKGAVVRPLSTKQFKTKNSWRPITERHKRSSYKTSSHSTVTATAAASNQQMTEFTHTVL